MKTVTLQEPGRLEMSDAPLPAGPSSGEALVRVRRIGVCGTDFHAFRGRQPFFSYPRVLGHELGVEVLEIHGDTAGSLRPGDHCAVEPYLNCGTCIACRRGKTNCCVNLKVLGVHVDGGMREVVSLPVAKLHRSDSLTLDQLALVETLGIGAHAVDRAEVIDGEHALVIGAGPIGLAVTQFARHAGADVTVMDVNESRLRFCREKLGVGSTIAGTPEALQSVERLTDGDLPTLVFDATGNPESMARSFQFVAHGGRLVFVGLFQGDVSFHDPFFHRREMTLLSSRNSTGDDFGRIIRLIEQGEIDTTPWITHRSRFDEVVPQFTSWLAPESGVLKAIIEL